MSKAFNEYKKFLEEYKQEFNTYESKIAGLILKSFDHIESKSSAQGNRAKAIVSLLEVRSEPSKDTSLDNMEVNSSSGQTINELSSLSVENFRGFTNKIDFSLQKPYTFIYGPNGTGKSSLCEALEYSLLDTIYEAENKRININKYIKNVYSGEGTPPILMGIDNLNNQVKVTPNLQEYEFSFIERNRIEGFARVSANTPQNQQQRLATLFGLEDFNNFVKNFNDKIDNYIDCVGTKDQKLKEFEKDIEGAKKELNEIPKRREKIEKNTKNLLENFSEVENLSDLKEKINGSPENLGLLERNNKEVANLLILKKKELPEIREFEVLIRDLKDLVAEYNSLTKKILEYKNELSLKELYESIIRNQENFSNNCPGCLSELYINNELKVPIDPYKNAEVKILEFQKVIELESKVKSLSKQIPIDLQSIQIGITKISNIAQSGEFSNKELISDLATKVNNIKINDDVLINVLKETESNIKLFNILKEEVETHNKKVIDSQNRIKKIEGKNKSLSETIDSISTIKAEDEFLNNTEEIARKTVSEFQEKNSKLIKEAFEEKSIIERNIKYSRAYTSLKKKLEYYNNSLPGRLVKYLNDNTLDIYNAINKYDHPSDLLKELKLPVTSGDSIKLIFRDEKEIDALHVLSEGHLRCLGLAILLAKNINDNIPFIIFDDVVNAIDDEHRKGIIETILGNKKINSKQLIVTTHGEEFIKELENNIPKKEYNSKVNRIDFLKFDETNNISIRLNSSRNYLVVAKNRLIEYQYRDCLANCRRALESLLNKLWKQIAVKYNVQVSVKLRLPNGKPDLMGIAQSLNKTIKKQTNGEYLEVTYLLEELIGQNNKHSIEWNYLNKGTHDEERESEFDSIVVKDIYELMERIDEIIMENRI